MRKITNGDDSIHNSEQGPQDGLTKREAIAMAAMQGMIAHPSVEGTTSSICIQAVRYADALIAELNKEVANEAR